MSDEAPPPRDPIAAVYSHDAATRRWEQRLAWALLPSWRWASYGAREEDGALVWRRRRGITARELRARAGWWELPR